MSIGQGHNSFPNKTESDPWTQRTDRRSLVMQVAGFTALATTYLGVTSSSGQNFITGLKGGEGVQPSGAVKSPQEQPAPPLPNSESEHQSDIAIYENIDPLTLPVSDKLFLDRDYLRREEINDVLEHGTDEDVRETFRTYIDDILTNGRVDLEKAVNSFLHNLEAGLEAFKSGENLDKYRDTARFVAKGTARDNAIFEGVGGYTGTITPNVRSQNSFLLQAPEGRRTSLHMYHNNGMRVDGNLNDSLRFDNVTFKERDRRSRENEYWLDIHARLTNSIEDIENPPINIFDEIGTIPLMINTSNSKGIVKFFTPTGVGEGHTVTLLEKLAKHRVGKQQSY